MPRNPAAARLLPLAALGLALAPGRAEAFPWMIHHGYTNCAQCHVDPSGGGVLTDYGRAQGEILRIAERASAGEGVGESVAGGGVV